MRKARVGGRLYLATLSAHPIRPTTPVQMGHKPPWWSTPPPPHRCQVPLKHKAAPAPRNQSQTF